MSAAGGPATVHRLKVTLRHVKPPIWRRIEVPSNMTLSTLAEVLEGAMGWAGGHLHCFETGGVSYEAPDDDGEMADDSVDERHVRLEAVMPDPQSTMRWDYDFGDGWEHDLVVEAIEPAQTGVRYPICLAGQRTCPPDDCGGPWGYDNLLAALADPTHPDHAEVEAWLPPGFDPEAFDIDDATEMMEGARVERVTGIEPA